MLIPLHRIASRRDLPLAFSFVVVGAVLALVITGRDLLTNPIFVFCLDVGRPGADLASARPVLARHQPMEDDPPLPLCRRAPSMPSGDSVRQPS
jgi:hypothetical protein